jgi:hypothetical protein
MLRRCGASAKPTIDILADPGPLWGCACDELELELQHGIQASAVQTLGRTR